MEILIIIRIIGNFIGIIGNIGIFVGIIVIPKILDMYVRVRVLVLEYPTGFFQLNVPKS